MFSEYFDQQINFGKRENLNWHETQRLIVRISEVEIWKQMIELRTGNLQTGS